MSPTTLAPYRISYHTTDGEHENVTVIFAENPEEALLNAHAQISDRFIECGTPKTVIITKIVEVKS